MRGTYRSRFTPERKTLYVANVPAVSQDVRMVSPWVQPRLTGNNEAIKGKADIPDHIEPPNPDDIRECLGRVDSRLADFIGRLAGKIIYGNMSICPFGQDLD